MTISAITPIETVYRGYRFRSRTEARWACFFDAAGIEWQYELDGYVVDGKPYLPDFWLPKFKMFIEIKPDREACEEALPLMKGLVKLTGHLGLLIGGSPNLEQPWMIHVYRGADGGGPCSCHTSWRQCPICDKVKIYAEKDCDCILSSLQVLDLESKEFASPVACDT